MKTSKAIEILQLNVRPADVLMPQDVSDAITLAIMALKKHQDRKKLTWHGMLLLLPGETPEEEVDP